MAIGICDWGIGGVGIYQQLYKRSSIDIVYFSDTGFTPYGKVNELELKARLKSVFLHFNSIGIDKIIVACNAASTVIDLDKNITGVIEHGVNLVLKSNIKEIGIVGGWRTIESEIYKNKLEEKGLRVYQQVAQPLSARIEAGDINSEALMLEIENIFKPLKNLSHILLACTHYPLIIEKIRKFTGEVVLLDPAEEMCSWILNNWELNDGNKNVNWQTTGDIKQMKYSIEKLYNIKAQHIQKITL